jgi:predicted DsbA family dithiol-disulfide isomerase
MSTAFSPELTEQMSQAVQQAWSRLGPAGQANGDSETVAKAKLARSIVAAVQQGRVEQEAMIEFALAHYARQGEEIRDRDP